MQELLDDAAKAGNLPELLRSKDSYALPTLVPNFGFVRAAVVPRARPLPLAVVALLLGGTAAGGMPVLTEYARTRPDPFLVGISGVLKKNKCGCPPGPQPYPHGEGWVAAGTQCEGVPLVGAHRLPPCPAVLQEWKHRRDDGGVLRPSRDRREARRRARRREHQEHQQRVRLPTRPVRRRSVGGGRLRLRRPAGGQRCTMRRPTAPSAPARSCSSAAPISASRTRTGTAVPPAATPTGRAHPIGAG